MTWTHYVNSILHKTNYKFTATKTTGEIYAGVIKAAGASPKHAAQHAADLAMLEKGENVKAAFINPLTGKVKLMYCVLIELLMTGQHI